MAINVGTSATVVYAGSAESRLVTVRNNGTGAITLSRDPSIVATGFSLASGASQQVHLHGGEELFAITGTTATVDVI